MRSRKLSRRQFQWVSVLVGVLLPCAAHPAYAQTNTSTLTPTPVVTLTPTPTSCRGDLPVVDSVTSPTTRFSQIVRFCGRIVGSSSMAASSEAGPAPGVIFSSTSCSFPCPNPGNASCNEAEVPLLPGATNHVTVCQLNGSCPSSGCVTVDGNGAPLEIVQVPPTSTPSPPATPAATAPAIPVVSSPSGPAGIAMISFLGLAMMWALRRAFRYPPTARKARRQPHSGL